MLPSALFQDRSGVTVANSNVVAEPESAGRNVIDFQNTSDTAMRVDLGKPATSATGYLIAAGAGKTWLTCVPSNSINVFCAASDKTFVLKIA